VTKTDIITN